MRRQRLTETSTWSTGFDGIQPNAMVQSSCKPSRFLSFMWPAELRSAHIFFFFYRIWIFQPCIWLNPYMYKIYMFLYSLISLLLWSIYEVTFFAFYWPLCHGRKWYHECFALSTCMFFFLLLLLLSQRKKVDAIDDVHCSISMHQHARAVVDHRLPAPARRHVCVCHLKRRKREIRQAGYAFDSGPWHVFTLWSRPKRAMVIDDSASSRPTWSSRLTFKRAGQTAKGLGRSR